SARRPLARLAAPAPPTRARAVRRARRPRVGGGDRHGRSLSRGPRASQLPRRRRLPDARRPLLDARGRGMGAERPPRAPERLRPPPGGPLPLYVYPQARMPRRRARSSAGVPLRVLCVHSLRYGVGARRRLKKWTLI